MGLPGLTRLDHIGFTVPDLDVAHDWLVDIIGCEFLYAVGPFIEDDFWMAGHLNVPSGTVMRELRFYRCGEQAVFEVFNYEAAQKTTAVPRNSDVGGHHVALYVNDIDVAITYLVQQGVRVLDGPTASRGPSEGKRWIYFLSPWGMQFELVSYPDGKRFDRTPSQFRQSPLSNAITAACDSPVDAPEGSQTERSS